MKKCFYCDSTTEELRPYGPKFALVCFDCAMATPEREKETQANFNIQFDACGSEVIIGSENGPIPRSKDIKYQ